MTHDCPLPDCVWTVDADDEDEMSAAIKVHLDTTHLGWTSAEVAAAVLRRQARMEFA